MASRRLESDRFFTRDYRPEVYTQEGLDWVDANSMRTLLLRHFPELEPALAGVANPFAPWQRSRAGVIELAPGIYRLGHGAGGRVSAFLVEDGNELSLVDTLFESDARLVLEAIRGLGRSVTDLKRIAITHGHRSHLGGLAALKRASGATVYAHRLGGRHRQRRPPRATGHRAAEAVAEADPVPARAAAEPAEARPLPGGRRRSPTATPSALCRCCTRPATHRATWRSRGPSAAS